ncbi:MAG: TonB-dependent receptor [Acidobacteria bacterium]|nr:TonB-dependent receptor [Acidobacteriota bacterium]
MRNGISSINRMVRGGVFSLWVIAMASSVNLAAQNTASISGVVKDQTGAVLPEAKVVVSNVETGNVRTTVAAGNGAFRVTALSVGAYQVEASLAGFQSTIQKGITLTIGRDAVVDFTLNVGDVTTQVTVTSEAPLIDTTTSTVGGTIDETQMREIPLNARSFIELVPLKANAVIAESGQQNASKGFGKKLSIGGTRYNMNSFLLDGADINDSLNVAGSAAGNMAGVETVREFKVIVNAYDSEYGRHSGGVVSAVTKSGTNELHGSVFEFMRNSKMDARSFFDRDPSQPLVRSDPAPYKRNQFGFAVGGPVRKDQTFLFGSFEGLRERKSTTNTFNVPGILMRSGTIPLAAAACTTAGGASRVAANGSNLCTLAIRPAMRSYVEAYPLPNVTCAGATCQGPLDRADGTGQISYAQGERTNQNYETVRLDHRFSDSDSFFGRFTIDGADQLTPGFSTDENSTTANRFNTIEETHIFSATLLSRTHFSFNRTNIQGFDTLQDGFQYPNGFDSFDGSGILGKITVTGLAGWGGSSTNPKKQIQNVFQFKEDINWNKGRHALKMGMNFERFQFNNRGDFNSGGVFAFSSLPNFMLGTVNTFNVPAPGSDNYRGLRQNLLGLYLQDDFTLKQGLTLNLGLRYEIISVPTEVNGKIANIRDISVPHIYSETPATSNVGDPYFKNPSLKNFAPRVGLAWDPFQTGKTSIRTGFGIFDVQLLGDLYRSPIVRGAPFFSIATLSAPFAIDFPNSYITQQATLTGGGGAPQYDGMEYFIKRSYAMKWSFEVQQQLTNTVTVETGYTATRALRLMRGSVQLNATPSVVLPNGQTYYRIDLPLPNRAYNRLRWRLMDGTSDYHSFKINLTKRFSHGFQVQGAYTFSKATDDSSTWNGPDYDNDIAGYGRDKMHGLSSYDVRNSLYSNFVYDLPGGNLTGATGKLLGGWGISGLLRLNSGVPFSAGASQPQLANPTKALEFVSGSTINLNPGAETNPTNPQRSAREFGYFDVSKFSWPANFRNDPSLANVPGLGNLVAAGNLGRNTLIAPGIATFDVTLTKDTQLSWLGESGGLQFRAEFFNVFNRVNFGLPSTNTFNNTGGPVSSAGQITSIRNNPRQIQMALKLIF